MNSRLKDWLAVGFALAFPSAVTLVYFVVLANHPAFFQQAAYAIGKTIQFVFPAVWAFLVLRERLALTRPRPTGLASGAGFGLAVMVAMICVYHWGLKPLGIFQDADQAIRAKVSGFGIDTAWKYAVLGAFYAVLHSLLEEYYWRWFVFRQLRNLTRVPTAVIVSSLGFMAHHVILMATFFGWNSPWAYLIAACVAIGGAVWAWIYHQTNSIYGPWVSHLLVDAAIFIVGYDMVQTLFV